MTARTLPIPRLLAALALSATGLLWNAAQAQTQQPPTDDAYAQVQRLFQQGQAAQALRQADDYIAAHPNDPQMRFIKAAALQVTGRTDEAEAILIQLTRDYPELAEPWNNLAVLYAARGQIDAAKTALDSALRIDPGYATALENLGDIEIRLALRSYEQASKAGADAGGRLSAKITTARRVLDTTPASKPVTAASRPAATAPASAASSAASQPAAAPAPQTSAPDTAAKPLP